MVASHLPRWFPESAPGYAALPTANYNDVADWMHDPIDRTGVDNDGETGTGWTTVDTTSRRSSTVNDTIAWTGTFCSFGVEAAATGVFAWKLDDGEYTNFDLTGRGGLVVQVGSFARGAHTITLKVVSGTITIERFLAV
jgi:hypothetical protein